MGRNDITIEEALNMNNVCYVDLRSEGEYAEDTIPGAINIPIFNNQERALIGTTYKQIGVEQAKELGLEIIAPKLLVIYKQLRDIAATKTLIVFCWRGGMRSKFVLSVVSSLGIPMLRISGGYKSYRKYVVQYLDREKLPHKAVVLHGLTGVGKTEVLEKLTSMKEPVLDIEGLAKHRGSVYGKIGMPASPSQKSFESMIVDKLRKYEKVNYFLVECESRRLGKLLVPQIVLNTMADGYKVLLYAKLGKRVARITKDYTMGKDHNIEALKSATSLLYKRLGKQKVAELNQMLDEHKFDDVFSFLLTTYYDPLYKYPQQPDNGFDLCVDTGDIKQAVKEIAAFTKKISNN
ncbi:tRNA 2-selenouridine(34) synthase MnmH [Peptococcaceae bacterium 1198_IL3148]